MHASETLLSAFDVDFIAPEALLFQTGYLTIAEVEEQPNDYPRYRLGYPNREVRRGLNESLLDASGPELAYDGQPAPRCAGCWPPRTGPAWKRCCARSWPASRTIGIGGTTSPATKGIGSSVFYAWFQASMDGVAAEDATSRGHLDLAVRLGGNAYLFEFKVAERSEPGAALAQLQARRYADKHRAAGRAVHLIGVEISAETRTIVTFQTAPG